MLEKFGNILNLDAMPHLEAGDLVRVGAYGSYMLVLEEVESPPDIKQAVKVLHRNEVEYINNTDHLRLIGAMTVFKKELQ